MIAHFIFLIFCLTLVIGSCPHGSFEWQSSCLFFKSANSGFSNAEITCRNLGGHLASIHDGFTNAVIGQEASNYFQETGLSDFWIGLSKLQSQGIWTWSDNSSFDYNDWKKGEPHNVTGNDCAALSWIDGYWNTQNCFKLKPFVCAVANSLTSNTMPPQTTMKTTTTKRPATTTSHSSSGSCDDGWAYYAPTKSCYGGVNDHDQNWNTSETRCQRLGAHLPSIRNMDELRLIFNNYTLPLFYPVWLGFYSTDSGQSWKWSDGTPFDYTAWSGGFPSQFQGQSCGVIDGYADGDPWYANYDCSGTFYSVCKKPSF